MFYEIYRHEHEGVLPILMLYVFYITTTPYLPCNNNNINRKDFYYTAITLTTGYEFTYDTCTMTLYPNKKLMMDKSLVFAISSVVLQLVTPDNGYRLLEFIL